jgi:N-acetyl-gamma-glutamyl-phosphate reductase
MGATGYAGTELLRLMASHSELEVVLATGASSVGERVGSLVPSLAALYPNLVVTSSSEIVEHNLDAVFLALPHGESQRYVPELVRRGVRVVDLGADFRLKDFRVYEEWYAQKHRAPELLGGAVYALVERHRDQLPGATLIAVPGCYPTATSLVLGPFCDRGVVSSTGLVVNALSGVSGAGRGISDRLHFSRMVGNAEAYGLFSHRHTPEIEQEIAATVLFTPHLIPVARGMLVSAYARVTSSSFSTDDALSLLRECYRNDPFVVVTTDPPSLKDPLGSNLCFVSAQVDQRTGWLLAMSSLDNLGKGAAGQAIQAWNVANGFDESEGLSRAGVAP